MVIPLSPVGIDSSHYPPQSWGLTLLAELVKEKDCIYLLGFQEKMLLTDEEFRGAVESEELARVLGKSMLGASTSDAVVRRLFDCVLGMEWNDGNST